MKKLSFLVAISALTVGVAFAASLNVPVFLDDAPSNGSYPPSAGSASFIALHNNTGAAIVATVTYRTDAGLDRTPAANTFVLPANTTYAFRPVGNDSTVEGPSVIVPNMTQQAGDFAVGSAQFTWTGGASDIQGRMTTVRQTTGGGDSFSFTLPEGL